MPLLRFLFCFFLCRKFKDNFLETIEATQKKIWGNLYPGKHNMQFVSPIQVNPSRGFQAGAVHTNSILCNPGIL